jgi:hypothetical protein
MSINFPTNTLILITVGVSGLGLVIWLMLSIVLDRLSLAPSVKRNWLWGAALVLAGWLIVRLALEFSTTGGQPIGVQATIAFVTFGLFVGTLPLNSATFRQIVRATPMTWIIGLHAGRVIGGLFLVLLDMKLLPANFAVPAGYGDVIVAILSLVVVYLLVTNKPYARSVAIVWNLLGILDLVVALTTGTLFIAPFVSQLAATGVPVHYLNYVLLIPTYGVPLVGVFHVYSLYQLSLPRKAKTEVALTSAVSEVA